MKCGCRKGFFAAVVGHVPTKDCRCCGSSSDVFSLMTGGCRRLYVRTRHGLPKNCVICNRLRFSRGARTKFRCKPCLQSLARTRPARTGTHGSEAALDTKSRDSQLTPVVALAILFQHLLRIVPGQPAQLILDEGEVEDMPRLCVLRLLRAVGTPAKHADAL